MKERIQRPTVSAETKEIIPGREEPKGKGGISVFLPKSRAVQQAKTCISIVHIARWLCT